MADQFVKSLSDISDKLTKLHWLVATKPRDNSNKAQLQRRETPALTLTLLPPPPPSLPRSLVYAFEELMNYSPLQAKCLSLENRAAAVAREKHYAKAVRLLSRVQGMQKHCLDRRERVQKHLQEAHGDIILSRNGRYDAADTPLDVVALESESVARALMVSVLDNSITNTVLRPDSAGDPAGTGGNGDVEWDVVRVYKEYSERLHSEAARRPRRRLFLDIQALVDELDALKVVLRSEFRRCND